ncbi:HdeD family acid-resistance protein [Massilia glaciei]|uniref:HdeD family acid-resistance protein n=1 Tax=Massilia glaciei TaxID=1524097 RepID=A0A2U2HE81_9BURK|nr:DUF308 domain-containing protein [Massilia glaciei]PWF41742.1 hypothetical protein C7C56_024005 [Massilia glaciei]
MTETLLRSWKMLALRGAIALLFGVLAAMWPGLTLLWLVALFAAFALLGGVVCIAAAVRHRKSDRSWWLWLLLGVASVAAAAGAMAYPTITSLVLILFIGANALVTGVIDIAIAVRLRKHIENEVLLGFGGAVSILFGAIVLLFPAGAGALALVWLISLYAIASGVLLLAAAWRVRAWEREAHGRGGQTLRQAREGG